MKGSHKTPLCSGVRSSINSCVVFMFDGETRGSELLLQINEKLFFTKFPLICVSFPCAPRDTQQMFEA